MGERECVSGREIVCVRGSELEGERVGDLLDRRRRPSECVSPGFTLLAITKLIHVFSNRNDYEFYCSAKVLQG